MDEEVDGFFRTGAKWGRGYTIIGCGGGVDLMTIRAKSAIEEADLIVGSRRPLDGLAHKDVTALVLEDNYGNIFEEVERVGKDKKVAFLVSGGSLVLQLWRVGN